MTEATAHIQTAICRSSPAPPIHHLHIVYLTDCLLQLLSWVSCRSWKCVLILCRSLFHSCQLLSLLKGIFKFSSLCQVTLNYFLILLLCWPCEIFDTCIVVCKYIEVFFLIYLSTETNLDAAHPTLWLWGLSTISYESWASGGFRAEPTDATDIHQPQMWWKSKYFACLCICLLSNQQ